MKKILSLILVVAMLATTICGLVSCGGGGNNSGNGGDEINMNLDLSQKPALNVLMPNSGLSIDAVNSNVNATLIEQLTG